MTLVEIAIVMVIMGFLIAIGASMLGPLTKRAKKVETDTILNSAVDAVVAYATTNKKLPLWTDGNDLVLSPNEFHYIIRTRNDAWSGPLFYRYSNNPDLSTADICASTTTNLTIARCPDPAIDPTCAVPQVLSNVAFIIYSRGANNNYQTVLPGPPPPPPAMPAVIPGYMYEIDVSMNQNRVSGLISIPNTQPPVTVNDPTDNLCTSNEDRCRYDDIVKYMTLTELQTKIGCTKYDRCSAGIIVTNQSGGNLSYHLNGGAGCTVWGNATVITLLPTNSYQIFTDAVCGIACSPQSFMTFSQQKDIDINNNCQTGINSGCAMVDR